LIFSKDVYQLTLSKIKFHLPVLKKIVKIGAPAGIQSVHSIYFVWLRHEIPDGFLHWECKLSGFSGRRQGNPGESAESIHHLCLRS
jgi:hypothetical protein